MASSPLINEATVPANTGRSPEVSLPKLRPSSSITLAGLLTIVGVWLVLFLAGLVVRLTGHAYLGDALRAANAASPALMILDRIAVLAFGAALLYNVFHSVSSVSHPGAAVAPSSRLTGPGAFLWLCALTVFAARLPLFLHFEMNPDESQALSAAITLAHSPFYWLSVDMGSHGPLIAFALLIPRLFGFQPDYATTRIVGAALLLCAAVCCYGTFRLLYREGIARLVTLPFVLFISTLNYPDMATYNAEHVCLPLLFLAIYLGVLGWKRASDPLASKPAVLGIVFAAGCAAAAMPFAKLQGVPLIALVIAVFLGAALIRAVRGGSGLPGVSGAALFATYCVGLAAPILLWIAIYASRGAVAYSWEAYIGYNLHYMNRSKSLAGILKKLGNYYVKHLFVTSAFWYPLILSIILGAFARARSVKQTPNDAVTARTAKLASTLTYASIAGLALGAYSVIKPGNGFPHYFFFLLPPIILLNGLLWGSLLESGPVAAFRGRVAIFYACAILLPLCIFGLFSARKGLKTLSFVMEPRENEAGAEALKRYVRPGDYVAVWGNDARYYFMTGVQPASRFSTTCMISMFGAAIQTNVPADAGARGNLMLKTYLDEARAARPAVFLDTAGPDDSVDGFRSDYTAFPTIRKWVDDNFRLVQTIDNIRIFIPRNPDYARHP